jgi:catechol 2,3-dioxygenase-like lactoylglutathione lyase family enzyme
VSAILNKIGTVFIPVRDIEEAKNWYCEIFGLKAEGEILFGHLFIIPTTNGTGIVLDSKIYSEETIFKTPLFHFDTTNIKGAYEFLKGKDVEITTEIEHNHYFNFKDPYGNHLMVCKC